MTFIDGLVMAAILAGVMFIQSRLFVLLKARHISDLVRIAAAKDDRFGYLLGLLFLYAVQVFGLEGMFSGFGAIGRIGFPLVIAGALFWIVLLLSGFVRGTNNSDTPSS